MNFTPEEESLIIKALREYMRRNKGDEGIRKTAENVVPKLLGCEHIEDIRKRGEKLDIESEFERGGDKRR